MLGGTGPELELGGGDACDGGGPLKPPGAKLPGGPLLLGGNGGMGMPPPGGPWLGGKGGGPERWRIG